MLNSEQNDEVSDTRNDDSSNVAGPKKAAFTASVKKQKTFSTYPHT